MPNNLYGPGDHFDLKISHVIPSLIMKMYDAKINNKSSVEVFGTGNAYREFLYIDDLVSCMIWAVDNIDKSEDHINVGTGEAILIKDLIFMIKEMIGYEGTIIFNKNKPDGMKRKQFDVSKINKLGWKAKTSFEDGLKNTIKYYEENCAKDSIS
jgi:GDP-L-fucose synthase